MLSSIRSGGAIAPSPLQDAAAVRRLLGPSRDNPGLWARVWSAPKCPQGVADPDIAMYTAIHLADPDIAMYTAIHPLPPATREHTGWSFPASPFSALEPVRLGAPNPAEGFGCGVTVIIPGCGVAGGGRRRDADAPVTRHHRRRDRPA